MLRLPVLAFGRLTVKTEFSMRSGSTSRSMTAASRIIFGGVPIHTAVGRRRPYLSWLQVGDGWLPASMLDWIVAPTSDLLVANLVTTSAMTRGCG